MSVVLRQWGAAIAVVLVPAVAVARAPLTLHVDGARGRTTWDSVFTAEQATRGQATYGRTCARCHQATLGGADQSPALAGGAFLTNWHGQTLGDLHDRVRATMPSDAPGTYTRKEVADVIAYVLSFNGFPAGTVELPVDDGALKAIVFSATKP